MTPKELQDLLVTRRKSMNITQQELSIKTGIHQSTLSHIENYNSKLNLKTFLSLLNGLELKIEITEKPKEN